MCAIDTLYSAADISYIIRLLDQEKYIFDLCQQNMLRHCPQTDPEKLHA